MNFKKYAGRQCCATEFKNQLLHFEAYGYIRVKYSPQHFEPRAKAVNVKGVANRAVATVLTAGLIAQPLMSPLAAIAAPSTGNGDSVQGG